MKTNSSRILPNRIPYIVGSTTLGMTLGLVTLTLLSGIILSSAYVSADNDSVVDQINITIPVSCTVSGTGMNTHNAEIANGTYTPNIGTTTLHAFCNDNEGFAIYAAGYTGDEIGAENSNKLVGTTASSNATIVSGIATTAGNPDLSNWAMKLAISQDSGDTTTNAFTIDSAPNVDLPSEAESGATQASFSSYHVVPNEYVKVAHKNSMTDMTASTGGVKLTTTYAAYISKTQAADTYSGQVIYTLVHPSSIAPVTSEQIGVNYHANGSTFTNGETINQVIYQSSPMYIATTPLIAKSDNVGSDGTQNGSYTTGQTLVPITATGADKIKVVVDYGVSAGTSLIVVPDVWDGNDFPSTYEMISDGNQDASGTRTYVFDNDAITMYLVNFGGTAPATDYDYGFYAQVYPIYATEEAGTEPSTEFGTVSPIQGTYTETTNWNGSWYADINNQHYDFTDESEVTAFISDNLTTLGGANIDLYRGLTYEEAYTRANKSQDGGYYKQQELTKSMCNTVAVTQNQTVKDIRDGNTYMIGKLKDGNCWMLDNLALDPTDPTTAANMNENNTNATQAAITNLLNGGSSTTGWSSTAVADVDSGFESLTEPMINNASKDTLVTSYGPASINGQAKVGIYYNFCAASVSTYCYDENSGVDIPDTLIDAPQDICPANWRMPTGWPGGEYEKLFRKYKSTMDATNIDSLQYNLSTPLSGRVSVTGVNRQDAAGIWWSSTSGYSIGSGLYEFEFILGATPELVAVSVNDEMVEPPVVSRHAGVSMRCLVGE